MAYSSDDHLIDSIPLHEIQSVTIDREDVIASHLLNDVEGSFQVGDDMSLHHDPTVTGQA